MNKTIAILGLLSLTFFFFGACSENSKKSKENEIVLAFAEEMLDRDDRIYSSYRENIHIFKRRLDFPLSVRDAQSSFDWNSHHQDLHNSISMSDINRWNKQIEDYSTGRVQAPLDSSLFVHEFKERKGYFDGDKFIGDTLKGKTYILSKPLIGKSFAMIFYDLSPDINSLSGGSIIFFKKEDEWIKVACNTLVSTP